MNLKNKLLDKFQRSKVEYLFLLVVGILFYILNSLSEFSWDDYYYMFICKDEHFFGNYDREYIQNFADVVKSQINHWHYVNGRFVAHVLVQLFICILGLPLFQICNSIIFVLLVKYLCKLCIDAENRNNIYSYIILFAVMWGLLGFMCIGLGYITSIAFAVNYLWSSALFVSFIYYYYRYKNTTEKPSLFKQVILFVFAVLTGAMNESFSVGLSASLFVYYLMPRNRSKWQGPVALLVLGLWAGTIICCVNPANIARFMGSNDGDVVRELLLRIFWLGSNLRLLVPILIVVILSIVVYFRSRHFLNEICAQYTEIIIAIGMTFLFLVAVGLKGNYQMFTGITLLCVVLIYSIIKSLQVPLQKTSSVLVICFVIHYVAVVSFSVKQKQEYNANINEYLLSNGIIEYQPIEAPSIVSAYGFYLPDSRKTFIYSGLELVYGYRPMFIPNRTILAKLDNDELYDAQWCYVMPTQEGITYEIVADNFTHKNWMLKLWSKFSKSASTRFSLDSYEVILDNRKYTIALKKNDDFIIHNVSLLKHSNKH